MNDKHTSPDESVETLAFDLVDSVKSLQLATIAEGGQPAISYTPFILHQQQIYIFISALAAHTQHLAKRPQASLLFIEDELCSQNIFARRRLTLECGARFIERSDADWNNLLDVFSARHGSTVELLKTLPDFSLVALSPNNGSYIQGFGQAYRFDGLDLANARQASTT